MVYCDFSMGKGKEAIDVCRHATSTKHAAAPGLLEDVEEWLGRALWPQAAQQRRAPPGDARHSRLAE